MFVIPGQSQVIFVHVDGLLMFEKEVSFPGYSEGSQWQGY
jgi:hypothetical protein